MPFLISLHIQTPSGENVSTQVGDIVYFTPTNQLSEFNTGQVSTTKIIGEITNIQWDGTSYILTISGDGDIPTPGLKPFISFSKKSQVSTSGLVGYYAEVKLTNNSKKKVELFSLGANIDKSSK
jgi:hypothetical protein